MFWRKKWVTREAFGIQVDVSVGSDSDWIMRTFEKAHALQEQNRRDYNLLFERQNLILKELGKEYVPESEKKEPAKLIDICNTLSVNNYVYASAISRDFEYNDYI
jgi:hypothetical protein